MSNLLPFPSLAPESARTSPAAPPDTVVRAQALDIRRSFIVEAPAGSGKTALLIQRLLKLLADDSITQPEQVLAITFTNAATAELRDRVLAHLESARLESTRIQSSQPNLPLTNSNHRAAPEPLAFAAAATTPQHQPSLFDELPDDQPDDQPDQQPDAQSEDALDFAAQTRTLARAVLARDAALNWQLLDHPSRLNIRTIDSVCAEIANTLPVLSGSGGRLAATENATPLHRDAARRTLLHLGSGDAAFDAALRNLLLHRDGNLADCETLLAGMLALRDQWGELIPLTQPELDDDFLDANVLPGLERALDRIVCASLSRLQQVFPADLLSDLAAIASDLGHLPSTTAEPSPIACCAGTSGPPEVVGAHLDRWLALIHLLLTAQDELRKDRGLHRGNLGFDYDRKHPHHPRLASIVDQLRHRDDLLTALAEVRALPPARYPANQWVVTKSLFRILARALVELQLVFAERGECDFTELSLLARLALSADSGAEDLASALGARLQHLLVDEMQDTSTGQYDLLELLTASWDGYSQTVFLVGDPHQSIYLFRQARVERFIQTLRTGRLGELPLTRLALTANFRSQRSLVASFNSDFPLIFPEVTEDASRSLPYIPADATLPASPTALGQVWHANPQPPRSTASSLPDLTPTQSQLDARTIARIAADWLARPLPPDRRTIRDEVGREIAEPWRIAVLVRARNHLAQVVPALRRAQLPFRAVDIETLHDRQEVLDLTALTRALLHPADRVAALAVLRAPWCGLSLADLHTLTGADDSNLRDRSILRIIEDRAPLLPGDSQQRLSRVHSVLRSAASARARLTASQLVERAWRSLGGDAPLTPPELTNARRFFELLDSMEAQLEPSARRIDPTQLEDRLTQLFAEPAPHPANTAFVELLTIHKAKGLEWDLVFLPALERQPAANTPRLLAWSALDSPPPSPSLDDSPLAEDADLAAHIMLAPIAARGEDIDALTGWLNRLHRARQYAENKRLFYVASTRARQELHLFAAPQLTADGTLNPHAASLLSAAWPAASPHFAAAVAAASTAPAQAASSSITPSPIPPADDETVELAASASQSDPNSGNTISLHINEITKDIQAVDANLIAPLYPPLTRLPLDFDPAARFAQARTQTLPYGDPSSPAELDRPQFSRPEGSVDARAFGNTIHACIELLTTRIASGATPATLLAELPAWSPRIAALLRSDGLPAATLSRLTRDAHAALENLLLDPDGQWLLALHPGAATELSLTAASGPELSTVRLDRIFRAGPAPHSPGSSCLWIVDYKTASHSASDPTALAVFLQAQRAAYAPQLEAYARALVPAYAISLENVRLALYLPALPTPPRLIWWPASAI